MISATALLTWQLAQPLHAKGCVDNDHDGLCDAAELELARRVAPVLKFPAREALLDRMRTLWQVHDAGRGEVVISYVQTYVLDIGAENGTRVQSNHPGDTEEVRFWLHSRDGRTFKLVRARYWHHHGGQEWAPGDGHLESVRVGEDDHPVVWIQRHGHGSYMDRETCATDPEGDGHPCGDGFVAVAAIDSRANAGEADAPTLDGAKMASLGFPGESAWEEKHNAFGVRGFCGGLPATGTFGGVTQVAGDEITYRRRVFAPVCAGPLATQWDTKPRGTEDIIYWQGLRSKKVDGRHARPAIAGDGTLYVRDGDRLLHDGREVGRELVGDPAAAGGFVAFARREGVIVRAPDGREHRAPLHDTEIALAEVGKRLYVVARGWVTWTDDGGATFAAPKAIAMDTRERPAATGMHGELLMAWRTPAGTLMARTLTEATPRRLADRIDSAPWATASAWDGGAAYVFTSVRGAIRYYKVGTGTHEPVEIPGAILRTGAAAASLANERLLLAHDGPDGLYVRLFDPNLF